MGLLSRLLGRGARGAPASLDEPAKRLPVHPMREIGPGGLPIAPSAPFRQSLHGGSQDLLEALRMGRISWPEFVMLLGAGGAAMGAEKTPRSGSYGA